MFLEILTYGSYMGEQFATSFSHCQERILFRLGAARGKPGSDGASGYFYLGQPGLVQVGEGAQRAAA